MANIIKSITAKRKHEPTVYRFEDIAAPSESAADAQTKAQTIIAEAQQQAEEIRRVAAEEGRRSAEQQFEQAMAQRMESVLPIVRKATEELIETRQNWQQRWEQNAVQLAVRIAQRIIRQEIRRSPQITLALVREALEMAAGAPQIKIRLNSIDFVELEGPVKSLAHEISRAANTTVVPDDAISRGGCRLETQHGAIDQQIETQLERIAAELIGSND